LPPADRHRALRQPRPLGQPLRRGERLLAALQLALRHRRQRSQLHPLQPLLNAAEREREPGRDQEPAVVSPGSNARSTPAITPDRPVHLTERWALPRPTEHDAIACTLNTCPTEARPDAKAPTQLHQDAGRWILIAQVVATRWKATCNALGASLVHAGWA